MTEPRPTVFHHAKLPRHDRGAGLATRYLVHAGLGEVGFLTGISEFDPRAGLEFHSHNCDESVLILDGEAMFETDDHAERLTADDSTWVPASVVHRFRNVGPGTLKILWTYGSPVATRTVSETNETLAIAAEMERSRPVAEADPAPRP